MFIIENDFIRTKSTKNLPKNKNLINFSKENRKAGILAEVLFWQQVVHKGKFYGINFNRQKIIGNYIVDFYVPALSLVIEIDGWSHNYELYSYNLFRHPAAEKVLNLKELPAACCHLFLKKGKGIWGSFAKYDVGTLRENCFCLFVSTSK